MEQIKARIEKIQKSKAQAISNIKQLSIAVNQMDGALMELQRQLEAQEKENAPE